MTEQSALPHSSRPVARRWAIALEGLTTVGAVAGVQGFLAGQFDPLVDQLTFIEGPAVPAAALAVCIAVPQGVALVLGLRRHPLAPLAALGAGIVLTGWVLAQLPLIGWESPVQWVFFAVGLAETAVAARWMGGRTDRPSTAATRRAVASLRERAIQLGAEHVIENEDGSIARRMEYPRRTA